MESIPQSILFLAIYHLIFFWKFYFKPYENCTGEVASTYFPHWIWCGRQWASGKIPLRDTIYYYYPGSIPFLSTFYPPHIITSIIGSKLSLNHAYLLYHFTMVAHYLLGSILSFFAFLKWADPLVALFGSITWTYAAYNIRSQSPCIAFMHAWTMGCFLGGWMSVVSSSFILYAGYLPLAFFFIPVASFLYPECLLGLLAYMPQLCLFIPYYVKSIRNGQKLSTNYGSVPLWRLLDLILPNLRKGCINGVLYPEMVMFCGVSTVILIYFSTTRAMLLLILSLILSIGLLPPLFRIPARYLHLLTFSLAWSAASGLNNLKLSTYQLLSILILQSFDLLRNRELLEAFPFREMWKKPSEFFQTKLTKFLEENAGSYRVSGLPFPLFTGYINNLQTLGYNGGFQLKKMSEIRGDDDLNGSGRHDQLIENYGIKYAYKPHTTLDNLWKPTSIRWLNEAKLVTKPNYNIF